MPRRRVPSAQAGAFAQVGDLGFRQVAPAAHLETLERKSAQAHARDLQQRMSNQIARRLERAGPRLGDHHLDPGVPLGDRQPVDVSGLTGRPSQRQPRASRITASSVSSPCSFR